MNKLINIKEQNGKQLVSARELYIGLGLNHSQWSRWAKKNIFNNDFFEEKKDWIGVRHNVEGNEVQDFAITLEFAKHIAMMARTEKSHEYRNYFIKCEKQLLEKNDVKAITGMDQVINQLNEKIDTLSKYCKINCSLKHQFIEYIKKRLGIRVTNSEYEQVKARIFLVLGVTKWEDINFELKEKVLNLIDESIKIIKSERPYEQRTFWD